MRLIAANALQESISAPMNPAGPNAIVDTKTKAERTTVVVIIAIQSPGRLIACSPRSVRWPRTRISDHIQTAGNDLPWQVVRVAAQSLAVDALLQRRLRFRLATLRTKDSERQAGRHRCLNDDQDDEREHPDHVEREQQNQRYHDDPAQKPNLRQTHAPHLRTQCRGLPRQTRRPSPDRFPGTPG